MWKELRLTNPLNGQIPCGRYGHTASVVGRRIFVFGGFDGDAQLHDVHVLNIENESSIYWENYEVGEKVPKGRYGHTASVVGTKVYVFGGNAGGNKRLNDVLLLDTEANAWSTPLVYGTPPRERSGHTAAVFGTRIYIFGGYAGDHEWLNDVHCFSTTTMTWTNPIVRGSLPTGRNYHTATAVGSRMYIFGGFANGEWKNDMYVLDVDNIMWSPVPTGPWAPCEHSDHAAWVVGGENMFVFGGYTSKRQLNDLHMYDIAKGSWSQPLVNGVAPCGRNYHTASLVDNQVYVFGGYSGNKLLNDLFVLSFDGVELEKARTSLDPQLSMLDESSSVLVRAIRTELYEAFQKDLRSQREQLVHERQEMLLEVEFQRESLRAEIDLLEHQKKLCEKAQKLTMNRVKLNVGGKRFETSIATLTAYPSSMFGAMFSGRYDIVPDENDGSYFIDRDGTYFIYILNFLRDGTLVIGDDRLVMKWLANEARYYVLPELTEALQNHSSSQNFSLLLR